MRGEAADRRSIVANHPAMSVPHPAMSRLPTSSRAEPAGGAGALVAIHIAAASGAPMSSIGEVQATAGVGLEGDRYAQQVASRGKSGGQVTLIESEALEAACRQAGVDFGSLDSRRNLVTRGVRLNELVGREFRIGSVTLRGLQLCQPCAHLVSGAGRPPMLRALVDRAGIRAAVLSSGLMRVGDRIETGEIPLPELGVEKGTLAPGSGNQPAEPRRALARTRG